MDELRAFITLAGVLLAAVVGLYVWSFTMYCKTQTRLGEIYKTMHDHFENTSIHVDPANPLQHVAVCNVKHTQIMDTLSELKDDTKKLLSIHNTEE